MIIVVEINYDNVITTLTGEKHEYIPGGIKSFNPVGN